MEETNNLPSLNRSSNNVKRRSHLSRNPRSDHKLCQSSPVGGMKTTLICNQGLRHRKISVALLQRDSATTHTSRVVDLSCKNSRMAHLKLPLATCLTQVALKFQLLSSRSFAAVLERFLHHGSMELQSVFKTASLNSPVPDTEKNQNAVMAEIPRICARLSLLLKMSPNCFVDKHRWTRH